MKVYELIEKLKKVDPNCDVLISVDVDDDYGARESKNIEVRKYGHNGEICISTIDWLGIADGFTTI